MATNSSAFSPRDHLARLTVKNILEYLDVLFPTATAGGSDEPSDSLHPESFNFQSGTYPILIIGAGVAGLSAALMLQDLGIDYEIVEAEADEDSGGHLGGRIYTHRFNGKEGIDAPFNDPKRYDYVDLGAMRYPDVPSQAPTFKLFRRLFGDEYDKFVIKYIMTSPGQLNHYNRTTCLSSGANDGPDVFKVAATPTLGPVPKSFVPKDFLEYKDDQGITHYTNDGSHWTEEALGPLVKIVSEVTTPKEFKAAWEVLVQYETFSTRAYLAHKTTQKPPKSTAYPQSVIEWLEMMNTGTGLYNNCLIESVFDASEFGDPQPTRSGGSKATASGDEPKKNWYCLDGGSDRLIRAMIDNLRNKPIFGTRVVAIKNVEVSTSSGVINAMEIKAVGQGGNPPGPHSRFFSQVISTVPLGCLASIDMEDCKLSYTQETAIRSLTYDSSTKVALRFEKRWWETMKTPIVGGVTSTDRPIRIVVYPSYGLGCPESSPPPGVLIGSYTWAQDAIRMGSIAEDESMVVDLVLNNLADIHGIPRDKIDEVMGPRSSIKSKTLSWSNEPHARGAFAFFAPGQFGDPNNNGFSMFASLKVPANNGRLHFAGEATSVHHAWVAGAINSAWRAVFNALGRRNEALRKELMVNWPAPNEEDVEALRKLTEYGLAGAF